METIFERMGSLATLLDDELQTIETRFRVLSTSSQSHFDGPAKKVVECQREIESLKKDIDGLIQSLKKDIDGLIHVADEQYKHFDGFLKGIIDTLAEFDEKIVQVEQHAANYGYVAPTRDNVDLPRILSDIEVLIQIHDFPWIRCYKKASLIFRINSSRKPSKKRWSLKIRLIFFSMRESAKRLLQN